MKWALQQVWKPPRCVAGVGILVLLAPTASCAQDSQFVFDPPGNFLAQTAETIAPPQILSQPQMQVVQPGEAASFSVVAADVSGLSYQWLFNGTNIPAATSDALRLSNISSNDQGYYSVVLVNSAGSVTSSNAPLWIDSRGCGMPDWWQLYYFGNLTTTATGDFDGDGVSNLQEFLDGTNPTNSASARWRVTIFADGGLVQLSPSQGSYANGDVVTLTATPIAPGTFHAWTGDIESQSNLVAVSMTTNLTVFAHFNPIDYVWTNQAGGDWSVATNWSPNLVPLPNDNAHIILSVTVTVTNPTECLGLFLGSNSLPTLSLSNMLTLHGSSFWMGGRISGTGRTLVGADGSLTLSNQSGLSLNGGALENAGTVLWTGAGSLTLSTAVITNRAGAVFEAQNAASVSPFFSPYRFDNAGTFRKTTDAGTSSILIPFNNYGTIDIETGTLLWSSGAFTNLGLLTLAPGTTNRLAGGGLSSGPFSAAPGALVEQVSGTLTLTPGAQLNGGGLYRVNGGVLVANTDLSVSNLDLTGNLDGGGTITVDSAMKWTTGSMTGSGKTVIAPGASLSVATASGVTLNRFLENGGTVRWTGAGNITVNGATITNRAGGLFEAQNAAFVANFSTPYLFENAGTFRKTVDPGTNTISIPFNNYGTVDIETGTLELSGGFTNTGTVTLAPGTTNRLTQGGMYVSPVTAAPGSLVEWVGGTFYLNPGAQLNGGGLYRINNGTLLTSTDISVTNLDLIAGTLDGGSAVTVINAMNWTGGTMVGSGRTLAAPGATVFLANANNITLSRILENGGTLVWTGAGNLILSSGLITNRAGALFEAQNTASVTSFFTPYEFDNAGVFRKTSNPGTLSLYVPFNNYGTVDLRLGVLAANGTYTSASNALLNCAIGGTVAGTNYGQLQCFGTVTLNGGLSVMLTNGFIPATNNSFAVLTAGTRNGTFASFYYPSNAVTMQLSNTTTSVVVLVTGVVAVPPPPPLVLSPLLSGSNVLLTWTAVSNATYRVEFNPNLAPSNWTALSGDVTSLSNFAGKIDQLTPSNRFYRVRVVP